MTARWVQVGFSALKRFSCSTSNRHGHTVKLPRRTCISYRHGPSNLTFQSLTVGQTLDKAAAECGNKIAVVACHQGISKPYTELLKDVNDLAAGFLALGLRQGDKIAIWSPNCYEWIATMFAAAKAGLVLVTINPAYQSQELKYVLKKVSVRAVISAERFKTQDYYNLLTECIPEIEQSKPGQVRSELFPALNTVIMISEEPKAGTFTFKQVAKEVWNNQHHSLLTQIEKQVQFDNPVNIQFTSGTTGQPKAAVLSHHNIVNNAYFTGRRLDYHLQHQAIVLPVPLFHCFGCIVGSLNAVVHGSTCVLPSPTFKPDSALQAIQTEHATCIYVTPTMLIDILNHPDFEKYDVSSLSTVVTAGSLCPEEVARSVSARCPIKNFHILYGTTENSPVVSSTTCSDPREKHFTTIGRCMDHIEAKIVDKDNKIVPLNTCGELCVRGYQTFLGYYEDEGKIKGLTESRWYHTGDVATMDEDGYLKIADRIKDVIIRGGENIYPAEIEGFFYTHPNILEIQVVGVPDHRMGEEVFAWIKIRDGSYNTEQEIKDFCKGKLSHFKIPRYIAFIEDFPKTASGKIQKFKLKEEAIRRLNEKDKPNVILKPID